ncbi:hypothetical protein K32_13920 [Kaistia sp. 32K]|uniref:hypothetical protein n=1 Tax=Kaistia sp. 32K TaxID=2795690 RepID=UPI0019360331|nr:hypothetical protein [Kaistia sp. 32K]BCP52775.1 hypothetical protein K32_13920 [Kaistia sp. 32K]
MIDPSRRPRGTSSKPIPVKDRAKHAVGAVVAAGVAAYRRQTSLPPLLPMMPEEMADNGEAMRRRIVARLARALRAERMRGRAGHWTYDINRHIALRQAYEAERLLLSTAVHRS